jgi:hypothetical protein
VTPRPARADPEPPKVTPSLRQMIRDGFEHGIPGEKLAEAEGLSLARVYQIRDGRRRAAPSGSRQCHKRTGFSHTHKHPHIRIAAGQHLMGTHTDLLILH